MNDHNQSILDDQPDAGVTLLELLVVMAILAVVVALAAPRLRPAQSDQADEFARQIASDLADLRTSALKQQRHSSWTINGLTRSLEGSPLGSVHQRIPDGLDVTVVAAKAYVRGASTAAIGFFRDGSSTGGRVIIQADKDSRFVDVDWLTGRIDISGEP